MDYHCIGTLERTKCLLYKELNDTYVQKAEFVCWCSFLVKRIVVTKDNNSQPLCDEFNRIIPNNEFALVDHVDHNTILVTSATTNKEHIIISEGPRACITSIAERKKQEQGDNWYHTRYLEDTELVCKLADNLMSLLLNVRVYLVAGIIPLQTIFIQSNEEAREFEKE